MTLTLFQGHRYVRIINCKLYSVVEWCMVTTHIKKIMHRMLCVTGVYLRDITNMIFVILHLNVSCLNICSSCFVKKFSWNLSVICVPSVKHKLAPGINLNIKRNKSEYLKHNFLKTFQDFSLQQSTLVLLLSLHEQMLCKVLRMWGCDVNGKKKKCKT